MEKKKLIITIVSVLLVLSTVVGIIVFTSKKDDTKGPETPSVSISDVVSENKTTEEDKTTTTEETSETEAETSTETTEEVTKPTQPTTKTPETTKKPANNSSGGSGSSNTTAQKPVTTTKPATTKQEYVGHADPKTGLSWDGTPIIYHYPDGTTSTTPIDGAKYEYTPGIWCVIVIEDPNVTTVPADMCSFGCGRKNTDCASKMHDWHCDVCNVDVKKWECHDRH